MNSSVEALKSGVLSGDTKALAKAITLFESTRPDHGEMANELLNQLLPHSGRSLRLAISGSPGVGKSTFIEAFGEQLLNAGHKLAVLAVDPSSPISGGSILGDRIRMETLSRHPDVFIRPSPAGTMLGGTAKRTREAIIACEAAGFDRICVETVGVGQSETLAASMTDLFVLLYLPNSGDDVQGIKRGILELADFVVITKADGALTTAANLAKSQIEQALMLTRGTSHYPPQVFTVSSITGEGIRELGEALIATAKDRQGSGFFANKRRQQSLAWLRSEFIDQIIADADRKLADEAEAIKAEVENYTVAPSVAARRLISKILKK